MEKLKIRHLKMVGMKVGVVGWVCNFIKGIWRSIRGHVKAALVQNHRVIFTKRINNVSIGLEIMKWVIPYGGMPK